MVIRRKTQNTQLNMAIACVYTTNLSVYWAYAKKGLKGNIIW